MTAFGFTGTRRGMTRAQAAVVEGMFRKRGARGTPWVLHHGGCKGADAEAHQLAQMYGGAVHRHLNMRPETQAEIILRPDVDVDYEPDEDLKRNRSIVHLGEHGLIATPRTAEEELRSGTWMTVRYARKQGRRLWIVRPDGTICN